MLLTYVLIKESLDQLSLSARTEVLSKPLVLFMEALLSNLEVVGAGTVSDQLVTFLTEIL